MESTFVADNFIFAGKQKLVYFTRCLPPFTKGRRKKKCQFLSQLTGSGAPF